MGNLTYGTPQEAGFDPSRIAALKDRAPEWVDANRMRSGVLLVARRGTIVHHEAYGPLTEKPDSPPMEKDTIFALASSSKPTTATCIMMLVERGLLGLNRPIKEYLPEICGEGTDDIEIQHLLTHTSGYDWDDEEELFESRINTRNLLPGDPETGLHSYVASKLDVLWDMPARVSPGSVMTYCDFNYTLLGEIVQRASGQSLDRFAQANVFSPLGMSDTTYIEDAAKRDRKAMRGDNVYGGGTPGRPMSGLEGLWNASAPWGGAGMDSTALDLATSAQLFLDKGYFGSERLLSGATVHEMTRNQIPGTKSDFFGVRTVEASWGLGWMIQGNDRWRWYNSTLTPKGTFYHGGSGGSFFWVDPVHDIVGVYLTVCLEADMETKEHHMNIDLFQNMVMAAVAN